jgi:hypothetical protein
MSALDQMTEAQYMRRITDYCDLLGLLWHHETDSRKSRAGWPDLAICGPSGLVLIEVKREDGRVSLDQKRWLNALRNAGASAVVARPHHWPDVKNLLDALAKTPEGGRSA